MSSPQIKTAIVGVGRWGKNVARELASLSELTRFATNGEVENISWANANIPLSRAATLETICNDVSIEAVAVATPIATHAEIARKLLEAGKHVFVEKPLAMDAKTAHDLAELAKEKGLVLATGYIFLYHPIHAQIRNAIANSEVRTIEFVWDKYGTFAEAIEWNLLTHHLAISLDLCGKPLNASVQFGAGVESACDSLEATLQYDTHTVISRINRASKEKRHVVRLTFANGSVEEFVYESTPEPLKNELSAFLEATRGGALPANAGTFGAEVLAVHEMLH